MDDHHKIEQFTREGIEHFIAQGHQTDPAERRPDFLEGWHAAIDNLQHILGVHEDNSVLSDMRYELSVRLNNFDATIFGKPGRHVPTGLLNSRHSLYNEVTSWLIDHPDVSAENALEALKRGRLP